MSPSCGTVPIEHLQAGFVAVLPRIELHARFYFRQVRCHSSHEEAVAETLALAWRWYLRLAERGKDAGQFVSALATFAARAVCSGRRVCGQEKARDVLSPLARQRHGFAVESLPVAPCAPHEDRYSVPHGQRKRDEYEERLHDNTITPPPDQAAFRIDFPAWLCTMTGRERRLIRAMARNERTKDLGRQFQVSAARISQLRREFQASWARFTADPTETDTPILV
jgi:hypothetical protein